MFLTFFLLYIFHFQKTSFLGKRTFYVVPTKSNFMLEYFSLARKNCLFFLTFSSSKMSPDQWFTFFPPYTINYILLFSAPLCENCQWRLRVWCQRLWRPNLQKCEEQAKSTKAGQALLQEKKYTRRNRKSRKIVQFSSRERHLPESWLD